MTGSSTVAGHGLVIVFTSIFTGQVITPDPVMLWLSSDPASRRSATNAAYSRRLLSSSGSRSRYDGCTVTSTCAVAVQRDRPAAFAGDRHRAAQHRPRSGGAQQHGHGGFHFPPFQVEPELAGGDVGVVGLGVDAPLAPGLEFEVLHRIGDISAESRSIPASASARG